jgi:hypothetical protein
MRRDCPQASEITMIFLLESRETARAASTLGEPVLYPGRSTALQLLGGPARKPCPTTRHIEEALLDYTPYKCPASRIECKPLLEGSRSTARCR